MNVLSLPKANPGKLGDAKLEGLPETKLSDASQTAKGLFASRMDPRGQTSKNDPFG